MGQIEWAMWANEQALASGLSEWGAAALGAGLQRAAAPGVRGAAAVQAGARAGEVGAWRPQAMAEERGRGQAGEGRERVLRSQRPWAAGQEVGTEAWGRGPRDWRLQRQGVWGPVLGAGSSLLAEPWSWGGGSGALLPLQTRAHPYPILCNFTLPPPHPPPRHKRKLQSGEEALAPGGFRRVTAQQGWENLA